MAQKGDDVARDYALDAERREAGAQADRRRYRKTMAAKKPRPAVRQGSLERTWQWMEGRGKSVGNNLARNDGGLELDKMEEGDK